MAKPTNGNGKAGIRERIKSFHRNIDNLDDGFLKLLIRLNMKKTKPPIVIRDNGKDKKNPCYFEI